MPPSSSPKPAPSAAVQAPQRYIPPTPGPIVVWRDAPGGEPSYAVVTKVGRAAISVLVFPTDSRGGTPKDGVRFVDDPWNKTNGISADSGVWDHTAESKLIFDLQREIARLGAR